MHPASPIPTRTLFTVDSRSVKLRYKDYTRDSSVHVFRGEGVGNCLGILSGVLTYAWSQLDDRQPCCCKAPVLEVRIGCGIGIDRHRESYVTQRLKFRRDICCSEHHTRGSPGTRRLRALNWCCIIWCCIMVEVVTPTRGMTPSGQIMCYRPTSPENRWGR